MVPAFWPDQASLLAWTWRRVSYVRLSEEFWTSFGQLFDVFTSLLRRLLSSVRRASSLLVVDALLSTTDAVRDVFCVSRRLLLF